MSNNTLYSHYAKLSEDNIKQNHCSIENRTYKYGPYHTKIDFDSFMKLKTPLKTDYTSCKCDVPRLGEFGEYAPDTRVFLMACEKSNIERSECLNMFDYGKVKNIDVMIAAKLTPLCNEKCVANNFYITSQRNQKHFDEESEKYRRQMSESK